MENKKIFVKTPVAILVIFYLFLVLFWIYIRIGGNVDQTVNYYYGLLMGLLPLIGGSLGIYNSRKWGGFKSILGKAVLFLSLGLVFWSIGTLIFAYYNIVLLVAVPYPSIADVAYIVSWPLWAVGVVNLARATGAKFSLKTSYGKYLFFLIPLLAVLVSYYLLFVVARGGFFDFSGGVKVFFDLFYPVGDIVILTATVLTYILSLKYLGGKYKLPIIIILCGFIINYLADFSFAYTTTLGTWYVANWVDLLYGSCMFLLSLGVSLINPNFRNQV